MTPKDSAPRVRRFIVYDFEWHPHTYDIRVAGTFDGRQYRHYPDVASFLDNNLIPSKSGMWFFAHAGGLADLQFVLEVLIGRPEFKMRGNFAGSSVVLLEVRKGRNRWLFLDSYFLLRTPLAEIGKKLGDLKGGPTDGMTEEEVEEWYATVPLPELIEYNEQDCRILWRAIAEFQAQWHMLGGQMNPTIGSSAMDLFRRRFLSKELPQSIIVNEWSRSAYVASRVEVFRKKSKAYRYYDINSSFPYSMTKLMPGDVSHVQSTLPGDGIPYLADLEIEVPDMEIPPLPYRKQRRIFFPTGKWRSYFFWPDVQCLLEAGGKINRVHDVIVFEPFWDLAEYAETLYGLRSKAEGFQREVLKYGLNSLYGKFNEATTKIELVIHPTLHQLMALNTGHGDNKKEITARTQLMPGVWLQTLEVAIQHRHVPLAGAITAWSRLWLWQYLNKAKEVYYCDTDGLAVSANTRFKTGEALGDMKLEKSGPSAEFLSPKVYRLKLRSGETLHKAKGFSLGRSVAVKGLVKEDAVAADFEELMEGREVELLRMQRIKENLRKGITIPWEKPTTKAIKGIFPKRYFYKNGKSRPWTVEELERSKVV